VAASVLTVLGLFHKELELTAYDPTHAEAIGLKPDRVRLILLILLSLTVVTGIQAVGVILTSALLITPAAAAGLCTRSLKGMMLVAVTIAVFAAIAGLLASYHLEVASGAAIVTVCTMAFVVIAIVQSFCK